MLSLMGIKYSKNTIFELSVDTLIDSLDQDPKGAFGCVLWFALKKKSH